MQQLLNWTRRLVYPTAIILLLWAGYQIIASPHISERNGRILAVYDGDSKVQNCTDEWTPNNENASEEALAGFCSAARSEHGSEVDLLNLHDEVNYPSDQKTARIYQQLAPRVARGSVLGVISFLASPDSPPLVRFCRTMEIPLLLAVAANDDLMAPAEDTGGIVFRMMPTNGRQAQDIATWLGGQVPRRPLRVAVFHEPNAFGEFLQQRLNDELRPKIRSKTVIPYSFEVTDQLQFADLMPQIRCENLDMIVYLGFPQRAMDLLNKLAHADPVTCPSAHAYRPIDKVTVLLSSGAYQEDLNDREKYPFPFKLFAMLSTPPAAKKEAKTAQPVTSEDNEVSGAFEYGYDSYALMEGLAAQEFKPTQSIKPSQTGHDYRFSVNGELMPASKDRYATNRYRAYPLGRKL